MGHDYDYAGRNDPMVRPYWIDASGDAAVSALADKLAELYCLTAVAAMWSAA